MRVRRLTAGCLGAALVSAAATGCGNADGGAVGSSDAAVSASTHEADEIDYPIAVPDQVTVRRPALVDTNQSVDDLPVWPGPDPSEFLVPSPPVGEEGELSGRQAMDVFVAAQNNAGELWNVGNTVQWLVVVPPS